MKTFWGSGCIAPRILDLGTRWRWVVSFTPRPLYPQGKSHWYPLDRKLGEPQSRSGRALKNTKINETWFYHLFCMVVKCGILLHVDQSPSWEANSYSASQKIPRFLWYQKVLCRVCTSPPPVPVLRQMNSVHISPPPHFSKIHSNIIFRTIPRSSKRFIPFRFPTKMLYTFLIAPMRATCPVISSSLIFITRIICEAPYYAVFSSLPPLPHS
jgi:hypothetical protein